MSDGRALLLAVPLRHLVSADGANGPAILPAGGAGDLDAATAGMPLIVMATDAGEAEVPAATWRATFVRRVPYDVGTPWPEGVPPTWSEEHPVPPPAPPPGRPEDDDQDDDEDEDDDEDDVGPQSFLEVSDLQPLPRDSWLFANELVGKQSRRGRSFRPRVPTIVDLPD
jgi:hypothetical protein